MNITDNDVVFMFREKILKCIKFLLREGIKINRNNHGFIGQADFLKKLKEPLKLWKLYIVLQMQNLTKNSR